jgi:hypothetical protein
MRYLLRVSLALAVLLVVAQLWHLSRWLVVQGSRGESPEECLN